MNSQPPPKGSLEDLFRHHLLESEAAAVPPRPLVWEHIDNSLLLAQNEKYRHRLLVHRWAVAASLLLAALAGGGWWHSQQLAASIPLAQATGQAPTAAAAGQAVRPLAASSAGSPRGGHPALAADLAAGGAPATGAGQRAAAATVPAAPTAAATQSYLYTAQQNRHPQVAAGRAYAATPGSFSSSLTFQPIGSTSTSTLAFERTARARQQLAAYPVLAAAGPLGDYLSDDLTAASGAQAGEGLLAARQARLLALATAVPAPASPALAEVKPLPATTLRRWRFGAEYAVTAFQPNIDFERETAAYDAALGLNTVSLNRAAAAEYRANLQAGLGQRLSLHASRWLGGRWALRTGLEASQLEAYSATSATFVGEQLPSFAASAIAAPSPTVDRQLRNSSYRYRTAGVPVEVHYGNPLKTGASFYGRVGAIVSALLNVRSEVANQPAATRTYTPTSANSPYRRLAASLRAAAGVHYQPARGNWSLNMGPVVEGGIQSLNIDPTQTFLTQKRPYSIGIEAGVELGTGQKTLPAPAP